MTTKQHSKNTKTDTVFLIIKKLILSGQFEKGVRLPSVINLAEKFSVSTFSIIKAFELLKKEKLIVSVKKSGVYVASNNNTNEEIVIIKPKNNIAEQIADMISNDILNGSILIGNFLPLQKSLLYQYKTSKETLRKTFEILTKKGLIHKKGSGFIIGGTQQNRTQKTQKRIYIIGKQPPFHRKYYDSFKREFYEIFELELQKYGITSFDYIDVLNNPQKLKEIDKNNTLGFIIEHDNDIWYEKNNLNPKVRLQKMINTFEDVNIPLIIYDYNSFLSLFPDINFDKNSKIYPMWRNDFKLGQDIGKYLSFMGHKKIALFSYGSKEWNKFRLNGLQEFINSFKNSNYEIKSYFQQNKSLGKLENDDFRGKPLNLKQKFLNKYNGYNFEAIDPLGEIYPLIMNLIVKDRCKLEMTPHFSNALLNKDITAWVCTDGRTLGIAASEFLAQNKIKVPKDLSLIVMNNDDKTMDTKITANDQQYRRAGYLAAHCIIGDIPIKKNKDGYIEIDGMIIDRGSVRKI